MNTANIKIICAMLFLSFFGMDIILFDEDYNNNHIKPSLVQQQEISSASNKLCSLVPSVCTLIENEKLTFLIKEEGYSMYIMNKFIYAAGAYTKLYNDGYLITLNEGLFSNVNQLETVLYHELMHIKESDFSLINPEYEYGETFETCKDHNHVKQLTLDLFERLVKSGMMQYQEHLDIARVSNGNLLDDCNSYLPD
ncbi:hypothetical protein TUM4438_41590 [Shewanella sairae]|uniref:Putative phage metallopeptidase domain-containing protein n=1 Tax=Shewanella sairae TaxID=190310 RepID=A0ABQ4PQZ7_9GAMM|nr:putative metallopeptidase [Shewanella sairae]GIU51547.1 hypothetical protein TUM4438_41590 [Shewanella sairae]